MLHLKHNLKRKIKLTKTNEDKTVLLDGAEFKIYYVDSNGSQTITANDGKKYTVSDSGISTKIISGTAVLYDANGKSYKRSWGWLFSFP